MTRASITIRSEDDRRRAVAAVVNAKLGMRVDIKEERRSGAQNDLMWPLLRDVSDQVEWYGERLSPTDWKDMFTASLVRARVVRNVDGDGFVQIGLHTSDFSKDEMSNLIELIRAFGAQHNVKFSEPDSAQSAIPQAEPDTPAAEPPAPTPSVAGNPLHWSALSDDWRDAYINTMTTSTTKATSIATRHETALQMVGGKPNELELDWMRKVARVVTKRDKGSINATDYQAEIERLRDAQLEMPAEAAA